MIEHTIPEGVNDMPIERYLARAWPMVPNFAWRALLEKRDIKINGERRDKRAKVRAGDTLALYLPVKYAPDKLEILYSDGALCAFIKPRGLPVDADAQGVGADTALTRLRAAYPSARLVHRLDAYTGGVMLAALNCDIETALGKAFRAHAITKIYECAALGEFETRARTLDDYITKDARASKVRVAREGEKGALPARLKYSALDTKYIKGTPVTRLEIELYTGRTHQIRAQLAHIRHPIIGDDKYGDYEANKRLNAHGALLWCKHIEIGAAQGLEKYEGMRFFAQAPAWEFA